MARDKGQADRRGWRCWLRICEWTGARVARIADVRTVAVANTAVKYSCLNAASAPFTASRVSQKLSDGLVTVALHFRNVGSTLFAERNARRAMVCVVENLSCRRNHGPLAGLRPTQGDEKRLLFSNDSLWEHCPPICHLDRSAAKWRDLCEDALSWKCFSTEVPGFPTSRC